MESDKLCFTREQLARFYSQAYTEGRNAKLVCGGLSKLTEENISIGTTAKALNKAYYHPKEN